MSPYRIKRLAAHSSDTTARDPGLFSVAVQATFARARDFENARFCRARAVPGHRAIVDPDQGLEPRLSGHRTSTGREAPVAGRARRAHIERMRSPLLASALFVALIGAVGAASAQHPANTPFGTSAGQAAPSMPPPAPAVPPGGTPAGARYPNTESLSRDRVQSQGYNVQRIEPRVDGSWKADATRNPVPTRPKGVPSKVTILPDGRMLEEYN
jgi:hypothetical protein